MVIMTLSTAELAERAARIRLVLTDCDGVLTDGGVYYSARGEELKRFSVRDGMGVERLRQAGISAAIITGESSPNVALRSAKLELPFFYPGVRDKASHLERILDETTCSLEEVAYIGDDVNDLEAMRLIGVRGLTAAPADAVSEVKHTVHHVCRSAGGRGAFREFADWILRWRRGEEHEQPQ